MAGKKEIAFRNGGKFYKGFDVNLDGLIKGSLQVMKIKKHTVCVMQCLRKFLTATILTMKMDGEIKLLLVHDI
jgi:hypothetical protein